MDGQTRVEHTLALAALVQCLVKELCEHFDATASARQLPVRDARREQVDRRAPRARRRAHRPARRRTGSGSRQLARRLLDRLREHAQDLGCDHELEGLEDLLAARQRRRPPARGLRGQPRPARGHGRDRGRRARSRGRGVLRRSAVNGVTPISRTTVSLRGGRRQSVLTVPGRGFPPRKRSVGRQAEHIRPYLEVGYSVVRYDIRGMPPSSCPDGAVRTIADLAADLARVGWRRASSSVRLRAGRLSRSGVVHRLQERRTAASRAGSSSRARRSGRHARPPARVAADAERGRARALRDRHARSRPSSSSG